MAYITPITTAHRAQMMGDGQMRIPADHWEIGKVGPFLPTAMQARMLLEAAGYSVAMDRTGGLRKLNVFAAHAAYPVVVDTEDGWLPAEEAQRVVRLIDLRPDTRPLGALPDGMARRSDGALWNPRPHPEATNFARRAYLAGYSDGFHDYAFGAGDDGSFGAFSDYRPGFNDGRADASEPSAA